MGIIRSFFNFFTTRRLLVLTTSRFEGIATFVLNPIFVDGFIAQTNSVCQSLLFTNGLRGAFRNVSANYTVISTDEVVAVNSTAASRVITLPNTVSSIGSKFTIIKADSSINTITVTPVNASTVVLTTQYQSVSVVADGVTWIAI